MSCTCLYPLSACKYPFSCRVLSVLGPRGLCAIIDTSRFNFFICALDNKLIRSRYHLNKHATHTLNSTRFQSVR